MNPYCQYVKNLNEKNVDKHYHDNEYGFPLNCDNEIFGRLILEINQAGLSWSTILKKKHNIRKAYSNYNINKISKYTENDINSLMNNKTIIRHKLKIESIIYNANQILKIINKYGSFKNWLDKNATSDISLWIIIFKKNFKFTGKKITKEFLMSTGYIKGAHNAKCPIYNLVLKKNPKWNQI